MRFAVSAAVLALAVAPASAQSGLVELRDDVTVAAFGVTVDRVDDLDVYAEGRKVGDVEDVLGTDATTATALVIDFDDGAGYGDRDDVIVPIGRFRLDGNRLVTDVTPGEVAGFPNWDD
jgi:hypothetical protein